MANRKKNVMDKNADMNVGKTSRVRSHIARQRASGASGYKRLPGVNYGSQRAGSSVISRSGFIKGVGVAAAGLGAAAVGLGRVAKAATPPVTPVYPTGAADDVGNVQTAVDMGGTVLLKSVNSAGVPMYFNFGDTGRVYLTKDVTILGEPGNIPLPGGMTATKSAIVGGGSAELLDYAGPFTCNEYIGFTVQNIHFHESRYCSIVAHNSKVGGTIEVTGCKGTGYVPVEVAPGQGPFILGLFTGDNAPEYAEWGEYIGGPDGDLHGTVNIHHNEIEVVGGVIQGTSFSCATMVNDIDDPEFQLKFNYNTLYLTDSVAVYPPSVTNVEIIGNECLGTGPWPPGVVTLTWLTPHFKWWITPGNCTVKDNFIEEPFLFGVEVDNATGPVLIENNEVLNNPNYPGCNMGGAIILGSSTNCTVKNNTITGYLRFAGLYIIGLPPWSPEAPVDPSYANVISGNDLSGSNAHFQVYVDEYSHHNSFKNNDYGPSRDISGFFCEGSYNSLVNENFNGNYLGLPQQTCVLFTEPSSSNTVSALKNGIVIQGFTICDQILDLTDSNPYDTIYDGANSIPGYDKCAHEPAVIDTVQQKVAEAHAKLEELRNNRKPF